MATAHLGSLLIITEDSGGDGHATILAIVKRMLQLIVPDYQTHRLGFEPKDPQAQRALQGTGWKSKDPKSQADRATALRTIATKLGRKNGFVLFHIDGDRTWTERKSSENVELFNSRVIEPVQQILRGSKITSQDAEVNLRHLFPVVPFYSIEAWLYQHTDVAIGLCREKYHGRDVAQFEEWRKDRTALDDIEKPKGSKTSKPVVCLKDLHNLECAGPGYPAQAVFDAGRSYAECVVRLKACAELRALLDATAGRGEDEPLQ
jgi:hypothetical protein